MPELSQRALSALRLMQPADYATAVAVLNLWAHVAEIDVDQVVTYYFTGGGLDCPEWCTVDHAEDVDGDLVLHQGGDYVDSSVRKLLDPHQLDVRVSRTDLPAEGTVGVPALYVRAEVEITTWQQAAELSRVILDSFGYLEVGAL